MTSYKVISAGAMIETLLLCGRRIHTKFHAFSTMCEIHLMFTRLACTITLSGGLATLENWEDQNLLGRSSVQG